jgi:hypothetical protein
LNYTPNPEGEEKHIPVPGLQLFAKNNSIPVLHYVKETFYRKPICYPSNSALLRRFERQIEKC